MPNKKAKADKRAKKKVDYKGVKKTKSAIQKRREMLKNI